MTAKGRIKVIVVDDSAVVRQVVTAMLDEDPVFPLAAAPCR